jgi:hypothetical protein
MYLDFMWNFATKECFKLILFTDCSSGNNPLKRFD